MKYFKRFAVTAFAAAVSRRHGDQIHVFLMIRAVVLHDVEHRDLMMSGCPQRARAEHEVAVAVERECETAVLLVGERRAKRGR